MKQPLELRNHLLICGFGQLGRAVARRSSSMGRKILVLEDNPSRARRAGDAGHRCVEGSLLDLEDARLGLAGACHALVAEESDERALALTLALRTRRADLPITTLVEHEASVMLAKDAGANRVLSLWLDTAMELSAWLESPRVSTFVEEPSPTKSGMSEVRIGEDSSLIGRSLAQLGQREASSVSYVALERPGEELRIPPRGEDQLRAGDVLMVWGDPEQVAWLISQGGAASDSEADGVRILPQTAEAARRSRAQSG